MADSPDLSESPDLPDHHESLWVATSDTTDYDPLDGGLHVDVAVVGGGITGLTTAMRLKEAGRDVAVVEADRVVRGVTGHTTAKVTAQHGLRYDSLVRNHDRETARQYAEANAAAVEAVADRADSLDTDVEFGRTEAYTYTTEQNHVDAIETEADVAGDLGLPASVVRSVDAPVDVAAALRFDDQAQFHPRKYLLAMVDEIHGDGSYVFEETRATDLDTGSPCRVTTERGDVVADDVVVATHIPVFDRGAYFARMEPMQSYLLGVEIAGDLPDGMFISADDDPLVTFRPRPDADQELLLIGGQRHRVGEDDQMGRYRNCLRVAKRYFDVESVPYRWSTHDYWPVDGLPFVGKLGPRTDNVYVGTGFGGWGMSNGTAAGIILSERIVEGDHPWPDAYDPQRINPVASARSFIGANVTAAGHFVGDRLGSTGGGSARSHAADLAPGEGRVVDGPLHPVGVYRDEDGEVHAVSAVCPHMGCIVSWNDGESTWDCPCHGSRFGAEGDVFAGPSVSGLQERDL